MRQNVITEAEDTTCVGPLLFCMLQLLNFSLSSLLQNLETGSGR